MKEIILESSQEHEKMIENNEDFIIKTFLDNQDSIIFVYNEFLAIDNKNQSAVDKYTLQGFLEAWEYMTINCNVVPLVKEEVSQG